MHRFRWQFPFVHEAEGTGGGGSGAGGAEGAPPVPAGETGGTPPVRPEWLPEGFEKPEDLAAAYTTLQGGQAGIRDTVRAELLAGRPETPDGYAWKVDAKALGLPDGFEVGAPDPKDPMIAEARQVLHELGAKPEQWDRLTAAFLKSQVAQLPDAKAERAKLGEGAAQRIADADAFLARNLPREQYDALSASITTAAGVQAVEGLLKLIGKGGVPAGTGGAGGGSAPMSEAEMRVTMGHKDYWHETRGAEMRAKVGAYFAAKHGTPAR